MIFTPDNLSPNKLSPNKLIRWGSVVTLLGYAIANPTYANALVLAQEQTSKQVEINLPPLEDQAPSINVEIEQEPPPVLELDDFDYWAEQCQQLVQAQQYEEGLNACNEAIAIDDTGKRTLPVWAARAEALIYQGQSVDALASLEKVLAEDSSNSLLITQQCVAYAHNGQYEDAVDSCETALTTNGNWGTRSPAFAWYYRGIALQELGFLETALWSFERGVRSQEGDPLGQAEWCHSLHLLGHHSPPFVEQSPLERCGLEETIAYYEQAAGQYPQDIALWQRQGLALEQLGDYTRALAAYEQGLLVTPEHPKLLSRKCGMLNQLDRYEEAIAACEFAQESTQPQLPTDTAYSLNQYSVALLGLERYEEALAASERAIAAHNDYAPAHTSKAVSLWQLGRNPEALAVAQHTLAVYAEQEAQYEDTFYRPGVEAWPLFYRDYGLAWFNQGRILASTRQRPTDLDPLANSPTLLNSLSVRQAYKESLQLPMRQVAMHWPERLGPVHERFLLEGRSLTDLVQDLFPLVQQRRTTAALSTDRFVDTLLNLSAIYMNGVPSQSLQLTQIATSLDAESFIGWYNMGLAAKGTARYDLAEYAFGVAQQLDPENSHLLLGMADSALLRSGQLSSPEQQAAQTQKVEEAIARYTQILEQDPSQTRVKERLLLIGRQFFGPPRFQDAIALYTHVLVLDPAYEPAKQAFIELGRQLEAQQLGAEAIATYDHLLNIDPNYSPAQTARNQLLGIITPAP